MANIGSIEPFSPESIDWTSYYDRVEQYFDANAIDDDKKVATLLTLLGPQTYKLLADLLSPAKPKSKPLADLEKVLSDHFAPKPLEIAERYRFHKRDQQPGESVSSYVAELRRLARQCNFGDNLETTLRDRFVCGLHSVSVCKALLSEKDLTLTTASAKATSLEVASRDASELAGGGRSVTSVNVLRTSARSHPGAKGTHPSKRRTSCHRCGDAGHIGSTCPHLQAQCEYCGKIGHLRKVCYRFLAAGSASHTSSSAYNYKGGRKPVNSLEVCLSSDDYDEYADLAVLTTVPILQSTTKMLVPKPIMIEVSLNGFNTSLQVDTGAAASVLPASLYHQFLSALPLQDAALVLQTYTGEQVKPLGQLALTVSYNSQLVEHQFLVLDAPGPALCGRDLLDKLRLDWAEIFRLETSATHNPTRAHERVAELKERYSSVFAADYEKLKDVKGKLQLKSEDVSPKFVKARPLPYAIRPKVEAELDRLEREGIVTKVDWSEWATPIVPVPKPNGSVRLCGDFKSTLNPHLKVPQHPLPRVEDVFASLAGGQHFSKIDLRQAYLQMEMDDDSKPLLTLSTHKGLYQLNRLGFGVASAPALWQQTMDRILQGIPRTECLLDDVITTGESDAEHLENLETVLKRLADSGLRVNPEKCKFFQESIEYCGHIVSKEGLHKTDAKIAAISDAPEPTNQTQLRSFLGRVNYYHRFLEDSSTTMYPLNQLLKKNQRWAWTAECRHAFDQVKEQIASERVLMHFDPKLPVRVATDASPYGMGAVLSHQLPDGSERPVAFASRALSSTEQKYAQIDKEALAIVWGVKKFHTYLFGRHFTLLTDHEPLTSIFSPHAGLPKMTTARLQRYAMFLASMDYTILYRKSADHANADGLSRLPLNAPVPSAAVDPVDVFNMGQFDPLPVSAVDIARSSSCDSVLSKAITNTREGWPASVRETELRPFFIRRSELGVHRDCLMWGARVIIPADLQQRILADLHVGHPGVVRMKSLARSYVWWPGLDAAIKSACRACTGCQQTQHAPPQAPLHQWELPAQPWQRIHVDFAGPFKTKMWMIVVDAFSKWPEVIPMAAVTTLAMVENLRHIFAQHGLPDQLVSDNGPQFTSSEFTTFLQSNGIRHIRSAPFHPATNGLAERFVQTFKRAMPSNAEMSAGKFLPKFLLAYRTSPNTSTNATPASRLMNRELRTRHSIVRPSDKQAGNSSVASSPSRHFQMGDAVIVRDYRPQKSNWIPGTVAAVLGTRHYSIEIAPDVLWRRHIDQIRAASHRQQDRVLDDLISLPHHPEQPDPPAPPAAIQPTQEPSETAAPPDTAPIVPLGDETHESTPSSPPRRNPPRRRDAPDRLGW